jgi:type IV secretory pathway VirB10-like protein
VRAGGKVAGPPPELLSIGVVDVHAVNPPPPAPQIPEAPIAVAEPPVAAEKPRRSTARKRAAAKTVESDAPKARAARKRPRKTASKVAPGSGET